MYEVIAELARSLQNNATYQDGLATVPAYLLEQLFLTIGLLSAEEAHYNEAEIS